jgi:hypothetical protein
MRVFLYFFLQRFTTLPLCDMKMAEELRLAPRVSFGFTFVFTCPTYRKNEQLQKIVKTERLLSNNFLANPKAGDT